jgi:glutamine synthetase
MMVTLEELGADVASGAVDTVLLVMTDMQGRLMGKRLHAPFFMAEVATHGAEGCYYLLTVDVDMNTVQGFTMGSWDSGYGDFVFKPDMTTLRRVPWLERTALVVADLEWQDGRPVAASPRQILRRQLDRLAERGWTANIGSELEFILFKDSYDEARAKRYHGLDPANPYNVDYSIFGTTVVEDVLRPIRLGMAGAGISVEDAKGECNFGQHEVNFHYSDALSMADNHSIYKNGAKEIAWRQGSALTFMAKYNEREGNSCHIHLSLRDKDDHPVFAGDEEHGFSKLFQHFLAGQLAFSRELSLFLAPNINSYKRFVVGSFAPTALLWGVDNRTCAFRVVGHGSSIRVECRIPGGDVNPYLALSALVAAGLRGVEESLPLPPAFGGNAYEAAASRVPTTLHEATELFDSSEVARHAFGDEVVDHYVNAARVEIAAFDSAVTDWERYRGFERL